MKPSKQLRRFDWETRCRVVWQDGLLDDLDVDYVHSTPFGLLRVWIALGDHWHVQFDWWCVHVLFVKSWWLKFAFTFSDLTRRIRVMNKIWYWKRYDRGDEWERAEDDE